MSDEARHDEAKHSEMKSIDTKKKVGRKRLPIAVFVIGILVLIGGLAFLIVRLINQPKTEDADFLVSAGEWVREDEPTVVWNFTEIGKGALTTDGHLNDYPFDWTINDKKLKIETEWLYDLADEFDYILDQGAKILTIRLKDSDTEIKFQAKERPVEKEETKEEE